MTQSKQLYTECIVFSGAYILILLALFVDSVGSPNSLLKYFSVSSRSLGILFLISLITIRLTQNKVPLISLLQKLNLYASIITLITSIILTIVDYVSPPNTVFAATRIQYTQLFFIGIVTGFIYLLGKRDEWFRQNYPKLIYYAAPVFFFIGLIMSLFPFDVFQELSKEDKAIETLQIIALMFSLLMCLFLAYDLCNHKRYFRAFLYTFVVVILFVVLGDEMSWGQRVFHITTPPLLMANNTQQELTLHNVRSVNAFVSIGYFLLGAYGAFAWIVERLFFASKHVLLYGFVPPWFTIGFFFVGFLYNVYITVSSHTVGIWSEYMELALYLGVMFTLIHFYHTRHLFWQGKLSTSSDE